MERESWPYGSFPSRPTGYGTHRKDGRHDENTDTNGNEDVEAMRTRALRFGLYADEQGLAWVQGLVDAAVGSRSARIVDRAVVHELPGSGLTTADAYDHLTEQWDWENPGLDRGAREAVELRVRLVCSLRTWRVIRRTVIRTLCPAGTAPHVCRVPWAAA
ncbi:hypothetical protein [Streptomyces sp. ML-6]|uniref:hypothetical protein n=1 Tax=Streptomyces sp. ML-6 TaxID=2982693 RepID=UPI0024BFA662|nr:hypothetical protein [Streptomyces sp. ML-6]MDK0524693.1 hypothetical protein [Streptomyces sp. ML-6]